MKVSKTLISSLVLASLLSPSVAVLSAQTVDQASLQTQLDTLKQQLIDLLTQEISALQAQIATLISQQTTLANQQASTTQAVSDLQASQSVTPAPVLGAATPAQPAITFSVGVPYCLQKSDQSYPAVDIIIAGPWVEGDITSEGYTYQNDQPVISLGRSSTGIQIDHTIPHLGVDVSNDKATYVFPNVAGTYPLSVAVYDHYKYQTHTTVGSYSGSVDITACQ